MKISSESESSTATFWNSQLIQVNDKTDWEVKMTENLQSYLTKSKLIFLKLLFSTCQQPNYRCSLFRRFGTKASFRENCNKRNEGGINWMKKSCEKILPKKEMERRKKKRRGKKMEKKSKQKKSEVERGSFLF